MQDATVTVIGASGRLGGRLLGPLACAFRCVQAVVKAGDLARLPRAPRGIVIAEGDIRCDAFAEAVCIRTDFLVLTVPPSPKLILEAATALARAPSRRRLRGIFHVSQWDADVDSKDPVAKAHGAAEAYLRESGIPTFSLRATLFAEQLVELMADSVAMFGETWLPVGSGKIAPVACRDIANLIIAIAGRPLGNGSPPILVSGPQSFDQHQIATRISAVVGWDVRYVEQPYDRWTRLASAAGYDHKVIAHLGIAAHLIKVGAFDRVGIGPGYSNVPQISLASVLRQEELALRRGRAYIGYWMRRRE